MLSEFLGTALLVAVGCSFVVLDFGRGSPVIHWIPSAGIRRALTGFLFGCVGGSIAVTRIGKVSGAHINPVVSMAFWIKGKLTGKLAVRYVIAQLAGAIVGTLPLLLWGSMAQSTKDAATIPGAAGVWAAALGEVGATFCLIVGLFSFVGHRSLRRFTPLLFPFLYAFLVYWEAPLSGTSTNPARSLGPAVVAAVWHGWWVYWVGPGLGAVLALGFLTLGKPLTHWNMEVAKFYHFHHDPAGIFHRRAEDLLKVRTHSERL
jgi:aquaporin Z